jgi:very-short-patch-repair endonuclease
MPRRWVPYRTGLTSRAQALRRDPTPAEKRLWFEFLRDLPEKFTRQKPLGNFIADFYCSRYRLAIELDGDSHYTDRAMAYDASRSEALALQGVRVLRFSNADVMSNFEGVCSQIREHLDHSPKS